MSELSTAVQAAESYVIDGSERAFPVLTMEDVGIICKELKKRRQNEVAAYCTENLVPFVDKMRAYSEVTDVTFEAFAKYAESPEGINRVLIFSLKKSAMKEDEALGLVKKIPTDDRFLLARLVSGIAVRVPANPPDGSGEKSS